MTFSRTLLVALLTTAMAAPAIAARTSNTDYIDFSLGQAGAFDSDESTSYGVEYRYKDIGNGFRPIIGFTGDDEGAAYGYAGVDWDLQVANSFYLIPTLAVGAYHQGDSQDLGGGLQFRTGVEAAYEFEQGNRLGVELSHLSNAGLHDRNPGTELLQVVYAHPLSWD